jgi:hypothetical protein
VLRRSGELWRAEMSGSAATFGGVNKTYYHFIFFFSTSRGF